jgi:uncharacterized protein (TIGR03435 family)
VSRIDGIRSTVKTYGPIPVFNDALRPYGLELQSRKLLVDMLVVDQALSNPTAN